MLHDRREHHEEIGRTVALAFVIKSLWSPVFHVDGRAFSAIIGFEFSSKQTSG
jgi:hypothetical protein